MASTPHGVEIRFRATPRDRKRLAALMARYERTASGVLRMLLARAHRSLLKRLAAEQASK